MMIKFGPFGIFICNSISFRWNSVFLQSGNIVFKTEFNKNGVRLTDQQNQSANRTTRTIAAGL